MPTNQAVDGLLSELGIGEFSENEAFQKGMAPLMSGSGSAATFAQIGQRLGRQIGPSVAGVINAVQDRGDGDGFLGNFKQGANEIRDDVIAKGSGQVDGEAVRKNRQTRKDIANMKTPNTGDPIADQQAALEQIIKIATANGDSGLAMKARAKQLALKQQDTAMKKAELGVDAAERVEQRGKETDSVGRTVTMQGDDITGEHSKAVMNEDGTWTVVRPDGTTKENVPGIQLTFVDPVAQAKATASQRDRAFETPIGALKDALTVNGLSGQTVEKKRGFIADMAEQASVVNDMTSTMLDMYDPKVAFSDSSSIATGADRVASFAETISSVFSRKGDATSETSYNGKKVSNDLQVKEATKPELYEQFLASENLNLRDILPAHIQSDTLQAQLFAANVMQLAYLDARLQEPSNRGLSDSDIINALKRIGAGSPNPLVFAKRQQQNLTRLAGKMDNLGIEFQGTSYIDQNGQSRGVSREALIEHVYSPQSRGLINDKIASSAARLGQFVKEYDANGNRLDREADETATTTDEEFLGEF